MTLFVLVYICLHFFHPLLWLDPNQNFFSDSDPSKSFGFFRIRIRNTKHNKNRYRCRITNTCPLVLNGPLGSLWKPPVKTVILVFFTGQERLHTRLIFKSLSSHLLPMRSEGLFESCCCVHSTRFILPDTAFQGSPTRPAIKLRGSLAVYYFAIR
jgi:hypothetical protein